MTVKTGHAIGSKVRWALLPSENLNEQLTGTVPAGTIGTTEELAEGTAYVPATATTNWQVSNLPIDPHDQDVSLVWYGSVRTTGTFAVIAQYQRAYGWMWRAEISGGSILLKLYTYWGGGAATAIINGLTDQSVHSIGLRFTKATGKVDVFLDGVAHTTNITWAPSAQEDITGAATFSMQNTSSTWKCITCQAYEGALSDAEFATLAADPFVVFDMPTPGVTLVLPGLTQTGEISTPTITVSGILTLPALTQTGSLSSVQINRARTLTYPGLNQSGSLPSVSINAYQRMKELLDSTPLYTWVKVNTTRYVDVPMAAADRPYNYPGQYDHVKIIHPWSSFAYDYDNNRILLWGGGHANYTGNQLYIWNGDTGAWELACLPSAVNGDPATQYIVDKKAPQSSHTYQNNLWLKENNMFCTFGGAATSSGGPFLEAYADEDGKRRVGPWLYDLNKRDPEKVGGSDGSGMDPTRLGLNAWQHRRDNVPIGTWNIDAYPIEAGGHAAQASVSISKNGKDYAIFTMDANSGFPAWYRYEFGNVRIGENDQCIYLGNLGNIQITEGWMVYDSTRDLVYRNAYAHNVNTTPAELVVKKPWTTGTSNAQVPIRLVHSGTGTAFEMQKNSSSQETPYGAAYDSTNDCVWMWSGVLPDTGVIYRINIPVYDTTTGWASTTWTVDTITPAGDRPYGQHVTPLLGKLKFVPEAGALITLDNPSNDGVRDADVWMFKTAELSDWTPPSASMFALF